MLPLPGRPPLPAIVGAAIDATSSIVTIVSAMVVSILGANAGELGGYRWLPLPLLYHPRQSSMIMVRSTFTFTFDFDARATDVGRKSSVERRGVGLRGAGSLLQLEP